MATQLRFLQEPQDVLNWRQLNALDMIAKHLYFSKSDDSIIHEKHTSAYVWSLLRGFGSAKRAEHLVDFPFFLKYLDNEMVRNKVVDLSSRLARLLLWGVMRRQNKVGPNLRVTKEQHNVIMDLLQNKWKQHVCQYKEYVEVFGLNRCDECQAMPTSELLARRQWKENVECEALNEIHWMNSENYLKNGDDEFRGRGAFGVR